MLTVRPSQPDKIPVWTMSDYLDLENGLQSLRRELLHGVGIKFSLYKYKVSGYIVI